MWQSRVPKFGIWVRNALIQELLSRSNDIQSTAYNKEGHSQGFNAPNS